jgi:hypothetical protein
MAIASKTINPLHFEDLEPHRFEDLVRQLIYDFRDWRALEATGRLGSDDGFDARGWEIYSENSVSVDDDEAEEVKERKKEEDRIWLIQCKREKSISPKKLIGYLDEIDKGEVSTLYGLIFVAACDFSKKARDDYRKWCNANGIGESHIWGRAEMEDMLFQPKYDHLLFAYFGISLQIRKRSTKTKIRSILAIKRQAIRLLGDLGCHFPKEVLLRDSDAHEYPYSRNIKDFDELPKWRVYDFIGHYHSGIKFIIRDHFAYIDDEGVKWDCEKKFRINSHYDDPWPIKVDQDLERKARHFWEKLPNKNRGTLEVVGLIPYDDILAIDEFGDEGFRHPHIYLHLDPKHHSFFSIVYPRIVTYNPTRESFRVYLEDQIKYFPSIYPEIE